jgi:hypothetical protein
MNDKENREQEDDWNDNEMGRDGRDVYEGNRDFLVLWDSDPVEAEKKYKRSRQKLISFGRLEYLSDPEGLADETIKVACDNFVKGTQIYAMTIDNYLFGIARNLAHKSFARVEKEVQLDALKHDKPLPDPGDDDAMQPRWRQDCYKKCLESCLEQLDKKWHATFILYHDDGEEDAEQEQNWGTLAAIPGVNRERPRDRRKGEGARKHNRQILAEMLRIKPRQLNRKMTSIRAKTVDCIMQCVQRQSAEQIP